MTLVALAAAQMLADDVDAWGMPLPRALLPLAGMTVIEHQAERARSVGAARMLLLVDGVPPALAEACDRVRARGMPVELVRDGEDVLRVAGDAARLLLVADGLIAGLPAWQAISGVSGTALLTTADAMPTQGLERIDAATRWAGLAVIEARRLALLADAPGDWDPQLMLLRAAVQDGVSTIAWDGAQFVSGDIALATSARGAAQVAERLVSASAARERGVGRRWLVDPLVRMAAGPLLASQTSGRAARALSLVLALGAGGAALADFPILGAGMGLAAATAAGVGDFVARFRPEPSIWRWAALAATLLLLAALALIERGATLRSPAALYGNGALAAVLLVALGERWRVLGGAGPNGGGPLADLPLGFAGFALLLPLVGAEAAGALIALAAAALLARSIATPRTGPNAV